MRQSGNFRAENILAISAIVVYKLSCFLLNRASERSISADTDSKLFSLRFLSKQAIVGYVGTFLARSALRWSYPFVHLSVKA